MESNEKALYDAMVACKVPGILDAVNAADAAGMDPTAIIDTMAGAMSEVGILFERGRIFLPHVLSAAAGMNKAMEILGPKLSKEKAASAKGTAVMGTVEGDVHDIGKSICSTMLQCSGFDIHDLGRDVPLGSFVEEVRGGCNYCGMSALMTTTMTGMKTVIEMLKNEGLRDKTLVMIGGAPVTQAYADKIGADIYGESASETAEKAKTAAE